MIHLRRVCDLLALVDEWPLLKAFAGLATMFLLHGGRTACTPYSNSSAVVSHLPAPPINGRLAVVYTPKCRSRFQRCNDILSAYVRTVQLYPYHDPHESHTV